MTGSRSGMTTELFPHSHHRHVHRCYLHAVFLFFLMRNEIDRPHLLMLIPAFFKCHIIFVLPHEKRVLPLSIRQLRLNQSVVLRLEGFLQSRSPALFS